jgi:hypothetical protein
LNSVLKSSSIEGKYLLTFLGKFSFSLSMNDLAKLSFYNYYLSALHQDWLLLLRQGFLLLWRWWNRLNMTLSCFSWTRLGWTRWRSWKIHKVGRLRNRLRGLEWNPYLISRRVRR